MGTRKVDGWKNPADMHEPPVLVEPGRYTSDDLDRIAAAIERANDEDACTCGGVGYGQHLTTCPVVA